MNFFDGFEDRLAAWLAFRQELEKSADPLDQVITFWNKAPISPRTCDPFDQSTWSKPWELISDNHFCEFTKILAMYYTLALTDRFKYSYFEIQIVNDREAHELKYLLIVDDYVLGYYYNMKILQEEIPMDLNIQASYPMLTTLE